MLIEAGTAIFFGRVSHIQRRRESEYRAAISLHKGRNTQSILVAGNSLLLEGVDFARLQRETGSDLELRRVVVEGTSYLDWYYGLRHLFGAGAQPDFVVLVLNPVQLTSRSVDGDYTAHFLLDRADLRDFATETAADRNRLSSLALANISFFYGARAEIRNWVLGKILPDLPSLTRSLQTPPKTLRGNALEQLAGQRLDRLQLLCKSHGTELVFVIPPANQDMGTDEIKRAAALHDVSLLVPIAPGVLPLSDYSDRFHLNAAGAGQFTPALATSLRQTLLTRSTTHTQSAALTQASRVDQ